MAMAIFLPVPVGSCGGGLCHHLLEKRRSAQFWKGVHLKLPEPWPDPHGEPCNGRWCALLLLRKKGYDHDHLPFFLSGEL